MNTLKQYLVRHEVYEPFGEEGFSRTLEQEWGDIVWLEGFHKIGHMGYVDGNKYHTWTIEAVLS